RGEGDIDNAVYQVQGGTLIFLPRVESQYSIDAASTATGYGNVARIVILVDGIANGDDGRGVPSGEVNGVQPLHVVCHPAHDVLGLGHDVHGLGRGVNDRCPGDADLRHNVPRNNVGLRNRSNAVGRVDKAALPELAATVRVEGINTVVFRSGKDDVVH